MIFRSQVITRPYNKGIDVINMSNILNRKEVVKKIPPYFKNQSVPIVSYSYTNSIGRKIVNYKEADNIFLMKRGKTLNSFVVFKYRLRSTINTIFEFVNPTTYKPTSFDKDEILANHRSFMTSLNIPSGRV
jgi:hypothetical protein